MTAVLGIALILSASPLADTFPHDDGPDHHEHDGVSDAASPAHTHGDADDHHETPDSPCHHHVLHCCCAHAHALATELPDAHTHILTGKIALLPASSLTTTISIHAVFHVPKA